VTVKTGEAEVRDDNFPGRANIRGGNVPHSATDALPCLQLETVVC